MNQNSLQKKRFQILELSKKHIMVEGWSDHIFKEIAEELNSKEYEIKVLFPEGYIDLLKFYIQESEDLMIKILKKNENLHKLTTHKKIFEIIRLRLQINSKDKELVRRTLGVLARPQNFLLGIRTLYATVDNIWYIAGDRSTDFNYYTKRLILSKIYSSTIIYWLNDESKSIEKTEKFLLKQIKNTSIFPKIKKTLTAIFR